MISPIARPARRPLIAACAAASLLVLPQAASANHLDPVAELRAEGANKVVAPGSSYATGTQDIETAKTEGCNGSGRTVEVEGPTALGILEQASGTNRRIRPLRVSDEFDFGLFVCGISDFAGDASAFWLYKVNHKAPEVGADQFKLDDGDEVFWYFQDTNRGINTGDELVVEAPERVAESEGEYQVRVLAYDAAGERKPAAGAQVFGPGGVKTADADGRVTFAIDRRGLRRVRAVRGSDIPSTAVYVCVGSRGGCERATLTRIVGSNGEDVFRGTRDGDEIITRAGDDRIDVRRGGRDEVRCGSGDDLVRADDDDRVSRRNCEEIIRR